MFIKIVNEGQLGFGVYWMMLRDGELKVKEKLASNMHSFTDSLDFARDYRISHSLRWLAIVDSYFPKGE